MTEQPYAATFDDASDTLTASGTLDEAGAGALRSDIRRHSADLSRTLRVDLTDVDYLPSAAVGVLATARRDATKNGVRLDLRAAEGTIAQRVLTICDLEHETA